MTPAEMAEIHAAAFKQSRPWAADEFASLMEHPTTEAFTHSRGFALVQNIGGEAELLTIAVSPKAQGNGIGRALMHAWMQGIDASMAFFEVAQDNVAAVSLYKSCGFAEVGRRKAYYRRKDAPSVDAIVMRCCLT